MKPGQTKQQHVWKDGKRVPFNVTAVKPKKPEEYNQPGQAEPEPGSQKPQETPKAAGSK